MDLGSETGVPPSPAGTGLPRVGRGWFLLPTAWVAWLLLWTAPSLLVGPRLESQPSWLTADSAPAAVVLAAASFLICFWPFWPALAGPSPRGRLTVRWAALGLIEAVLLIALATPFVIIAGAVADRPLATGPMAACAAGLVVLAMGLRLGAAGLKERAARWFMFAAMLVAAGPILIVYAAQETLAAPLNGVLEISPLVAAMRLAVDGWPADRLQQLLAWPAAGVILMIIGGWTSARRARARAS